MLKRIVFEEKKMFFKNFLLLIKIVFIYLCLLTQSEMTYIQINLTGQSETCISWIEKHVYNDTQLHMKSEKDNSVYIKLNTFKQLNEITCDQELNIATYDLLVYLEQKTLIESNINFTGIFNLFDFLPQTQYHNILITNINGLNQFENESKNYYSPIDLAHFEFYFQFVNFEFYLNKTKITKEMCKHENFYGKQIDYFWPMKKVFFNHEVSYTQKVCPYVFLNSRIEQLGFYQITNSLIYRNCLEFVNIDGEDMLHLKGILYLEIHLVYEEVSIRLLNPYIFKDLKTLNILGSPTQIQKNLFENFTKLTSILFYIDNLKQVFHNGIEWTLYLNRNLSVDITDLNQLRKNLDRIIILEFLNFNIENFLTNYEYPDEDLCLFEKFPHEKLILFMIPLFERDECSCSIIWLLQMQNTLREKLLADIKFRKKFKINFDIFSLNKCWKNFTPRFDSCQFDLKFKKCKNSIRSDTLEIINVSNLFFLFEWLKFLIEVYLRTILSCLGLITNFLTMLVVKNRKCKKKLDNFMYKHIFFNALFNFVYCFISCLSLVNVCIFPKSSFCSRLYKLWFVQNFKIYFGLFLSNGVRLCSNISFILFSLSRFYISASSNKNRFFCLIEKLNLKKFYSILFVSCLFWSIFKLFEYRINEVYSSFDKNFPYNRYDLKYCKFSENIYMDLEFGCKLLPILNLINNILNNILFLFTSLFIDICMIRFSNENYQRKKKLFHDKKHLNEALEFKRKIRKLIFTNGMLFLMSHTPEFISTVLLIGFEKKMKYFFFYYLSGTEINEIFETFSLISISLYFFVFKHFDHNFIFSYLEKRNGFFNLICFWKKNKIKGSSIDLNPLKNIRS